MTTYSPQAGPGPGVGPGVGGEAQALAHVVQVVSRSGSSFALGMKVLPPERRHAMFAIYAFCREVDDVADDEGDPAEKLVRLGRWREEIERLYQGRPTVLTTRALAGPVARFALPQGEFLGLIDGMEMDARADIRAPDWATLRLYCRRVAGTVGLLSLPVFGAKVTEADQAFALALADALQLTNILRDVDEDAGRGRLYLPRELLLANGIDPGAELAAILADPALARVCEQVAVVARQRFDDADAALRRTERWRLRPALLMGGIYDGLLHRLMRRGWSQRAPLRISKWQKLWAALRYGLLR
ncbi:Presqualene diphosphate synthase [uncultured Gammaproteobacteria bacterium]